MGPAYNCSLLIQVQLGEAWPEIENKLGRFLNKFETDTHFTQKC